MKKLGKAIAYPIVAILFWALMALIVSGFVSFALEGAKAVLRGSWE